MPEGCSGGGEGLQNDGDEKREEAQGREEMKKGWMERGEEGEGERRGSDIDTQSKAQKKGEKKREKLVV